MGVNDPRVKDMSASKKFESLENDALKVVYNFYRFYIYQSSIENCNQAPGGLYVSTQIFLTEAYFFQKIENFQKIFEFFYSGLILVYFCSFSEFDEENKLALKFNFTYWERISAPDFDFFIDFLKQI